MNVALLCITHSCEMPTCCAAEDPNALAVFVSILTGPPGPKPEDLLPEVASPVLILWGDSDIFTPLDVRPTHAQLST
jgi:pimeloyl-ACP methyl ester carboxylesterase